MAEKVVRLFSPQMRAKYAQEHPNTPSGVIFEWRGARFNLMPFSYGEILDIAQIIDTGREMLQDLAGIQSSIQNGAIGGESVDVIARVLEYIVGKAPALVFKLRDHLARSPGICDGGTDEENAADRAAFEEWFLQQDAKAMTLAFLPKLREVFGNHPLEMPTPDAPAAEQTQLAMTPTTST